MGKNRLLQIVLPWMLALVLVAGSCMPVMAATQRYYFDLDYMLELQHAWVDSNGYSSGYKASSFEGYCYYMYDDATIYVYATTGDFRSGGYDDSCYYLQTYSFGHVYYFIYDIPSDTLTLRNGRYAYYIPRAFIDENILVTTMDLLDSDGNVFFQPTLPRLYRIAEGISAEAVLREILTMLPLLIPLLAGYLGFRKGLNLLSAMLRKA